MDKGIKSICNKMGRFLKIDIGCIEKNGSGNAMDIQDKCGKYLENVGVEGET
jgi:hypothetical protein